MKALKMVVHMEDGKQHELIFSEPKPSGVSGQPNQNASGKITVLRDGKAVRYQIGCNMTELAK